MTRDAPAPLFDEPGCGRQCVYEEVSPFTVFLAVLTYLLFVAYVIHFDMLLWKHEDMSGAG